MQIVNVRDARSQLKALLDRVEMGEEITIQRRGKIVARLVPPARRAKRLPSLKTFRDSVRLTGTPLSITVMQVRQEERF